MKQVIQRNGHIFRYMDPGHGAYILCANGYSYRSNVPEWTGANKSFSFAKGDTVQMLIDYKNKRLKFTKTDCSLVMELPFEHPAETDLNVVVVLYGDE